MLIYMYFNQLDVCSAAGWFYSYFAILCLCVFHSLGRPGNELIACQLAGSNYCC